MKFVREITDSNSTSERKSSPLLGTCLRRSSTDSSGAYLPCSTLAGEISGSAKTSDIGNCSCDQPESSKSHQQQSNSSSPNGSNSSGHRVHHSHASATLISTTSTVINGSTNSPNSSPSKLIRSSGRRLQSIWTAVKRFSPVNRLKTGSPLLTKKRKTFEQASRVCLSHPDLSVHDLSSVCKPRSRDDLDILAINKAAAAAAGAIGVTSGSLTQKDSTSSDQFDLRSAIRRRHSFTRDRSDEEIINSYITSTPKKLDDSEERQRIDQFRQHPFYQLEVHLQSANNLLAKDSCGTSDPYVKFKIGNKQLYKSRIIPKNLNPIWDEYTVLAIDDVFQPLMIKVYDHDFGLTDDYLGTAILDLTRLEINKSTELEFNLTETGLDEIDPDKIWGQIYLTVNLVPRTQEEKEQYYRKPLRNINLSASGDTSTKKLKTQQWDSVVNIVLVEGKNLTPKDENGLSDPYVKFQLGKEKHKSKVIPKSLNPIWNEQFDLHTFPDQSKVLELFVYDRDFHGRDDFMGKATINLNNYNQEETHSIWSDLQDGEGSILLMLTISGTLGSESISNLATRSDNTNQIEQLKSQYGLVRSFKCLNDVGFLEVKVFRAEGLIAADLGGKSDPFCVVELVNARVQTNTEYKTLCPEWNKIFTFPVRDIHEVLELTVYDEDRDKKFEFLGKVAIPLLKIVNGEKKWFPLKDKKLLKRTKGRILLEMTIYFNHVRACIRTFNPREIKVISEVSKFKKSIFVRNVYRVKSLAMEIRQIYNWINSCFQWENVPRSIISFITFLLITFYFQLFMVPLFLLLIFLRYYIWNKISSYFNPNPSSDESADLLLEGDEDDDKDQGEEKKSLMEKFNAIQEVGATVQNALGMIASYMERVKNTFNFSVPFLSWLAIVVLIVATIIVYFIPLRYIIMAWGVNKFTKKLRNPNYISNNELIDFLSRIPDIDELVMYRELNDEINSPSDQLIAASNTNSKRTKKRQ
ncbi:multiple C2 and transmembrane domain-containing protein-like isoform X2 [Panonychus citri]|uniref:multiple C2 and transmembrane domain-containing protein-like isoform X2 n=1 Tax=Panonychus citri TaxID=50023 RepID=UPI002307D0E7|nr:multiple C2 and transmembrane domain-containing protein-like isoform X2 [Panonychus citri]